MKRGNAVLIGAFVVAGLALVVLALLVSSGGRLFTRTERAVMYFQDSVYGLQVGAPVVFRGVRLGSVSSIGLLHQQQDDHFTIPVVVELARDGITSVRPDGSRDHGALTLSTLVDRGMTAQLSMQSLLTGQLYVELDLRPGKPASRRGAQQALTEIPTSVATIQNLKAQLEGLDLRRMVDDIGELTRAARQLLAGPALQQSMADLQQLAGNLRRLSARLDRRADPLADALQGTMAEARQALGRVGQAADGITDTTQRAGRTIDQAGALVAADGPTVRSLQRAVDDLAHTAGNLRAVTGSEAPLIEGLQRTLDDVARASRAVRELADLLERHPDALLRGRPPSETPP